MNNGYATNGIFEPDAGLIKINPDDRALIALKDYIERETGLAYSSGRLFQFINRVSERIEAGKFEDIADYYDFVTGGLSGEGELEKLLERLVVRETSFFRNQPHFHTLREYVLPVIISNKKFAMQKELRLWSAGCATGQEPYSIAIAVLELLGLDSGWKIQIFATDISREAVMRTEIGKYEKSEIKNIPGELLNKYFDKGTDRYTAKQEVRKIVYPMYHNLTKEAPFYGIDVIFCRNVLIYFAVPTIRRIAGYLHTALNDNGFLFLGHSESLYGITDRFRLVDFAGLLLYRKRLKIAGT